MLNVEVEDFDKGDEEVTDVAKADVEKTLEVKDDAKKIELPLTSSSLSISSDFGDQFLKLSFDSSLVSTIKDTTDAEINSLLEVKIQSEVPNIQPSFMLRELKKHRTDLIQKYYLQQIPELPKKQTLTVELEHESKKTPIEDENAIDKEVADRVQDHKRKHEDDDDEDPLGKSALENNPVEELIAEVVMDGMGDDVVHDDDQTQDASEPKTAKTLSPEWFTQLPRPLTPDLEWNKREVVLDQPEQPWFNQMVSTTKDHLTFDNLMATRINFSKYVLNRLKINNLTQDILLGTAYNLLKGMCSSSIELEYHFQECFNALTDRLDWNNPEEDRYPFDLSKPLPLQGHPGHLTVAADYFFNNELEYLKSSDPERTYTTSIMKSKAAQYEIEGIEDMVPTLWSPTKVGYDKDALKGIKH
nr:hypothetical protein [Tanacetum cinerariifolium]